MTEPASPFELEGYLERERSRVESALERALEGLDAAAEAPVEAALRHGVRTGGKRLRPILCATAYRVVQIEGDGRDDPTIYDLSASLELVHAYSLMHDDLPCMDDAELRRGKPASHRVYGEGPTVVAGALLIPRAAQCAWSASRSLGLGPDRSARVVRELLEAAGAGGMVGGQLLDLLAEEASLDTGALDRLHQRKTGALLTAALRMGALAGGAGEAELDALGRYGEAIGLAFQITDDVLDATASAGTLGKVPSDQELNKATYVRLEGVEGARQRAQAEVQRAVAALASAEITDPALEALAGYVIEREW